jgi:hypothetical protein
LGSISSEFLLHDTNAKSKKLPSKILDVILRFLVYDDQCFFGHKIKFEN